jgi:opacity protein-like surface antigen
MTKLWKSVRLAAGRHSWLTAVKGVGLAVLAVAAGMALGAAALGSIAMLTTTTARADSVPKKGTVAAVQPAAQQASGDRWSGAWIAATLGYGVAATDISDVFGADLSLATHDLTYGAGAGFDHRFAGTNLVLGAGCDVDFTRAETAVASWDRQWACWGRGGVLLSPALLVYGLAGYTSLDGGFAVPELMDRRGLTFGAGLETAFLDGWFLRAEGRRVDLGGESGGGIDVESTQYAARLSVGYRFDFGAGK